MRTIRNQLLLVAPITVFFALEPVPARAEAIKDQCVDANGEGQELRREGNLSAARERLVLCSNQSCPAMVRDDCSRRLDELEKAQPTIAFEARDASGSNVVAVKVTVDGKPLTEVLDGTALRVDVGRHVFTFELAGGPPVTRTIVMAEGEKGRREVIKMGAATALAPMPASAARPVAAAPMAARPTVREQSTVTPTVDAERPSSGPAMGTQKMLGLVTGGVGLAGVALGSVFGLLTLSEKSNQQNDCSSSASCSINGHAKALAHHSNGMIDSTISTAAFIAGGSLLVGGAVLFFTAATASEQSPVTGILFAPSVWADGAGLLLRGEF